MTDFQQIAAQRPSDIDEAILCMQKALDYYHQHDDYRAVFLRAYYLITLDVHAAMHQAGDYQKQIFFDPPWLGRLAGKFSTLYFVSLDTFKREADVEVAWKMAHAQAREKQGTVLHDLLLGLNAHINYDLAYGIYLNLKEHGDDKNHLQLPRRKFDHDQVNNILVRCIPKIQDTLTRDYGGALALVGRLLGRVDDLLAEDGLKYYRERVWWNAVSYLTTESEREQSLVRDRLNWESTRVAKIVADRHGFWNCLLRAVAGVTRMRHFGHIEIEQVGDSTYGKLTSQWRLSPF